MFFSGAKSTPEVVCVCMFPYQNVFSSQNVLSSQKCVPQHTQASLCLSRKFSQLFLVFQLVSSYQNVFSNTHRPKTKATARNVCLIQLVYSYWNVFLLECVLQHTQAKDKGNSTKRALKQTFEQLDNDFFEALGDQHNVIYIYV